MSNLPKVAIVGRMNVGKSTLFNRLSTDVKSMTFDYPGVTRDFISDVVSWQGVSFELLDTGGIEFKKTSDSLQVEVQRKVLELLSHVDLLLFVVDARVGVTNEDREVLKYIHTLRKPFFVIVNKVDSSLAEEQLYEFYQLGSSKLFSVSAIHAKGIGEVLEAIIEQIGMNRTILIEEEPMCKVVLLGKPNVGKSSILNSLLKYERSLVSDIPGTTREAISAPINFHKQVIELVDTAGVRRKRGVSEELEQLMVKSSLDAVKSADLILLVVDISQGLLADQELKLIFYALEQKKAVILLLNKIDLLTKELQEDFERHKVEYEFLYKKIEILKLSCKTGEHVGKILPLVHTVWERYNTDFPQDELSNLFKSALINKPLYHSTELIRLYKVKQVKTKPPTIVLIVNNALWLGEAQLGFFENLLRKKYTLKGVPITILPRNRS